MAAPLSDLCGKDCKWEWGQTQQTAFDQLKRALCSSPVLILPDFARDFTVETDASDLAIGGVLSQDQGSGLQPVAYYSRKLRGSELNYPTHDRELMAVFHAVQRWRPYLDGRHTVVLTDHRALEHIQTQPNLSKRQVCWMEYLGEFHLSIQYRPGADCVVPDALSRMATVVCEPGWLARVYRAQCSDSESQRLRTLAESQDGRFRMVEQ